MMRQIRFRFDGQPINETDTPSQVRLHLLFSLHMNTAESLFRTINEKMEAELTVLQSWALCVAQIFFNFYFMSLVFQKSSGESTGFTKVRVKVLLKP